VPQCPWCQRRVWFWQSNLYGGPCSRCWRAEAGGRDLIARAADRTLVDERLEGTWRSDAALSVGEWNKRRPMTDEQAAELMKLFGYLRVTYAGQQITYDFSASPLPGVGELSTTGRYTVVARDATSAVILAPNVQTEEISLAHLRFCGPNTYWVHTELSPLREYFVRE
jgi:hypothetical protein